MVIAREGLGLILVSVVISLVFWLLVLLTQDKMSLILANLFALSTLFLLFFFRDPERMIPSGPDLIVSPSDGRVIEIEPITEHDFLGSPGRRISVFLSPLDVHIIRSPMEGQVLYSRYARGGFKAAYKREASQQNENLELGLVCGKGKLVLRQIAGFLARRIVCRAQETDHLSRGARLGIIKFGSRVELILPENVEISIRREERVRAGETVIGVFR